MYQKVTYKIECILIYIINCKNENDDISSSEFFIEEQSRIFSSGT